VRLPVSPPRLLIVVDQKLLAETMALALRQRGFEVHHNDRPSADDVIETARRLAPAVVLLDLGLEPSLGPALIAPLIGAGSRVVMLSSVIDGAHLGACIEAGAWGVVDTAGGFELLVQAVQRAVDGVALLGDEERHALLAGARDARVADRERLRPFNSLSPREQAVLVRLLAGESAEAIAARWCVSVATVRSHIRAVLLKLGINTQLAAVAAAREARWPPAGQ
jgi:DNA-binding NarL/FixJ family response regulator